VLKHEKEGCNAGKFSIKISDLNDVTPTERGCVSAITRARDLEFRNLDRRVRTISQTIYLFNFHPAQPVFFVAKCAWLNARGQYFSTSVAPVSLSVKTSFIQCKYIALPNIHGFSAPRVNRHTLDSTLPLSILSSRLTQRQCYSIHRL